MKYRQAKKIIKRRFCGWFYNDPSLNKAIVVFVHHQKKDHDYFEKRGILKELRDFYERKK